jgi:hypothetical protein
MIIWYEWISQVFRKRKQVSLIRTYFRSFSRIPKYRNIIVILVLLTYHFQNISIVIWLVGSCWVQTSICFECQISETEVDCNQGNYLNFPNSNEVWEVWKRLGLNWTKYMGVSKFFISGRVNWFTDERDSGVGIFIINCFLEFLNLSVLIIIFIWVWNFCLLNLKVHVFYSL